MNDPQERARRRDEPRTPRHVIVMRWILAVIVVAICLMDYMQGDVGRAAPKAEATRPAK